MGGGTFSRCTGKNGARWITTGDDTQGATVFYEAGRDLPTATTASVSAFGSGSIALLARNAGHGVEAPGIEPSTRKAASRSFWPKNRHFDVEGRDPSYRWIPRRSVAFRGVGARFGARSVGGVIT
jgi:hypothetical protein